MYRVENVLKLYKLYIVIKSKNHIVYNVMYEMLILKDLFVKEIQKNAIGSCGALQRCMLAATTIEVELVWYGMYSIAVHHTNLRSFLNFFHKQII